MSVMPAVTQMLVPAARRSSAEVRQDNAKAFRIGGAFDTDAGSAQSEMSCPGGLPESFAEAGTLIIVHQLCHPHGHQLWRVLFHVRKGPRDKACASGKPGWY
jgi:hypothetical protein